jgi:hypothetical protein
VCELDPISPQLGHELGAVVQCAGEGGDPRFVFGNPRVAKLWVVADP